MPKRKTTGWSKELEFIKKSRIDIYHAFCTLCRTDFDISISSKGKGSIERHTLKGEDL